MRFVCTMEEYQSTGLQGLVPDPPSVATNSQTA